MVMFGEAFAQRVHFVDRGEEILGHVVQQQSESFRGERGALQDQGLLLALVLSCSFGSEMTLTETHEWRVVFEELGQIKIFPAVETLLIEVHRANPELRFLEVRRDDENEIV